MTVRSFPFEGQDEAPEDDYYRLHRESGVLSGLNLTLSGLNWSLGVGEMYVGGSMMLVESTPATGLSQATTGSLPRRDILVARRTLLTDGRSTTVPVLRQGTPAANPTDPLPIQQRVGVWEEPLFSWRVPAGGATTVSEVRDLRLTRLADGTWSVLNMAARPTTGRYSGMRIAPRDRPSVVYVWDTFYWMQEGLSPGGLDPGFPAGCYVTRQEGSSVLYTGNSVGGFNIPLPFPFSANPLLVSMNAGDSASELTHVRPIGVNHTAGTIHGQCFTPNGPMRENQLVRVNWVATGFNT